jgi:Flp pilus assembly protein TadG
VFTVWIGVTAIFGRGAMAFARTERARREGRSGAAALDYAVVALAALVCVAAIVVGFLAMTHK